jgi:predicted kinase
MFGGSILSKAQLILISGLPCTGKTTLGRRLAADLQLPFVHKDGIKETLFNVLGWKDREWSKQLGGASQEILFYFIECQLKAGQSCIAESTFRPDFHMQPLQELKRKYRFELFQIECYTEGEVLFERFKTRSESGDRHPGHVDHLNYAEFRGALLKGRIAPLEIEGMRLEVDTTDFQTIPYDALLESLRSWG